jgi:predicted DNA-binding transcriptional regulator YafY
VEGYHLPPVMFTHEEASALFIGGEFVQRLTDESLKKHAETALLKIRAVLPVEKQEYLERLQEATAVLASPSPFQDGFRDDALATIQDAIVNRYVLGMEYYATSRDAFSKREVEPLGLLYYSDHWHLIAYCRLRQDYRDFRTDQIKSMKTCQEIFLPREGFSLKQYLQQANRIENPQEVRIKFKSSIAHWVRGKYYYGLVEEAVEEDGIIMTFLVHSAEALVDWLLSFGTWVEIIHPPRLRELLLEKAKKIAAHYDSACRNDGE